MTASELTHLCDFCTGSTSPGRKDDAAKPRPSLLPLRALQEMLLVLEHGAVKYGDHNWRRVEGGRQRYLDAALRHALAYAGGERLDPESGRSHLAHAAVSLMFVLELEGT